MEKTIVKYNSTNPKKLNILFSFLKKIKGSYTINFSCKQGALNDGKGVPNFVSEVSSGNYVFEWATGDNIH